MIFTDMDYQGRYEPQGDRTFNGEQPIFATIARQPPSCRRYGSGGFLVEDDSFSTGVANNMYVGRNPLKVDADLLELGQRRFNTYCSPCHDRTGQGRGLVGQRAIWIPTNLQEASCERHERRRNLQRDYERPAVDAAVPVPGYRSDRWAIVAYVRALQRTSTALSRMCRKTSGRI